MSDGVDEPDAVLCWLADCVDEAVATLEPEGVGDPVSVGVAVVLWLGVCTLLGDCVED